MKTKEGRLVEIYLVLFLLFLVFILYYFTSSANSLTPLIESWEKSIAHQKVPSGLFSLSAQDCGVCHPDHYKEWKTSTHAHAWTDEQFQSELKKESSPFFCINCHIPLQNQQKYIVEGLIGGDIYKPKRKKNPHFDVKLQSEGITCAVCHVRDGAIIGPTGTNKAPHTTKKDKMFLSETLCIGCHNASAVITPTLACSFETGDEWKSTKISASTNCISCHMESVQRALTNESNVRSSRLHYFAGSGIPKIPGQKNKGLNGLSFKSTSGDSLLEIGEEVLYILDLKNEFAGHRVPTGDPERFIVVNYYFKTADGIVIDMKSDTIGEKWSWFPEARKISDNNMNLRETRSFEYRFKTNKKGTFKLFVSVEKHRLSKKQATYNKLSTNYPLYITIFDDEFRINVI